jgi:hypothetical protein
MKLKELKNKKSYRVSGVVLSVVGLLLTFTGFISSQLVSADSGGYFISSNSSTIMIACGAALIIGSIVTFVFLFMSE